MMFSKSSLEVFNKLLSQVTVRVSDPEFDSICADLSLAKIELVEAMKESEDAPS